MDANNLMCLLSIETLQKVQQELLGHIKELADYGAKASCTDQNRNSLSQDIVATTKVLSECTDILEDR